MRKSALGSRCFLLTGWILTSLFVEPVNLHFHQKHLLTRAVFTTQRIESNLPQSMTLDNLCRKCRYGVSIIYISNERRTTATLTVSPLIGRCSYLSVLSQATVHVFRLIHCKMCQQMVSVRTSASRLVFMVCRCNDTLLLHRVCCIACRVEISPPEPPKNNLQSCKSSQ